MNSKEITLYHRIHDSRPVQMFNAFYPLGGIGIVSFVCRIIGKYERLTLEVKHVEKFVCISSISYYFGEVN